MPLISAALLGLGLGAKHAIEADHVAAVCALVARQQGPRRRAVASAARCGALWGLGHGAVIVVAGGALIATGARVPTSLATALDAAVAVMLVVLGVSALRKPRDSGHAHDHDRDHARDHDHAHTHEYDHDHDHGREQGRAIAAGAQGSRSSRRPLFVGLLHGASGTAALTLLVASTIPGRAEALTFVLLFGAASVAGMALAAALLAWPLHEAARRAPAFARGLRGVAGLGSIAAGVLVAWAALTLPTVG